MNLVGASILAALAVVVSFAPRRWALLGMMAGVFYLTHGQHISLIGFNLYAVRFLELAGFIRVMVRREFVFINLNGIDTALFWLYAYTAVIFVLRSSEGQAEAIGKAVDAYLCYFAFRGMVGNLEDFQQFLRAFVFLLVPFVALVVVERLTQNNPFAFMGGLEGVWLRDGKVRCQGSFRHASLMGGVAAAFLSIYIGLACGTTGRKIAWVGVALCATMVFCSNSGGPKVATALVLVGWALWSIRDKMRIVRWGIVGGVLIMALLMKAPVWYLPNRFSGFTGGDSWHRCYLVDVTFQHFDEWWFAGMPITATAGWFPHMLMSTGGADITNQFIAFGLSAGVGAIALFILLLTRVFRALGKSLTIIRGYPPESKETEFLLWGMGAMLVAHIANWWGISYWDQTNVVWFLHLAAISNLSDAILNVPEIQAAEPTLNHESEMHPGVPAETPLEHLEC